MYNVHERFTNVIGSSLDIVYPLKRSQPLRDKRRVHNFFIGPFDAPKYDFIWAENGDVIDSFIP